VNVAVMFCVPTVVNVVGSVAVANAAPVVLLAAVGTTVTMQEPAVPQAEKVTEPVGPAPLLVASPPPGRGVAVPTLATRDTCCPACTVVTGWPLTAALTAVCVEAGVIVMASAGAALAL
jgi:hypothetical protein